MKIKLEVKENISILKDCFSRQHKFLSKKIALESEQLDEYNNSKLTLFDKNYIFGIRINKIFLKEN